MGNISVSSTHYLEAKVTIRYTLLALAAALAFSPTANASIESAWWDSGSASGVTYNSGSFVNGTLNMDGNQNSTPGQIVAAITTTGGDPTLTVASAINNDTGGTWVGFQVNVFMNNPFSFSSPNVSTPADWTVASVVAPTLQGSGMYEGTLNLASGTPVVNGASLDFSYAITFSGLTSYSFTQQMMPVFVPETGKFAMAAAFGALMLVVCKPCGFRRGKR